MCRLCTFFQKGWIGAFLQQRFPARQSDCASELSGIETWVQQQWFPVKCYNDSVKLWNVKLMLTFVVKPVCQHFPMSTKSKPQLECFYCTVSKYLVCDSLWRGHKHLRPCCIPANYHHQIKKGNAWVISGQSTQQLHVSLTKSLLGTLLPLSNIFMVGYWKISRRSTSVGSLTVIKPQ